MMGNELPTMQQIIYFHPATSLALRKRFAKRLEVMMRHCGVSAVQYKIPMDSVPKPECEKVVMPCPSCGHQMEV